MHLTGLVLSHFRTYVQTSYSFLAGVTVIVAPNASGKTNLLEAIYLLATGRSFRAEKEEEVIAYNCEIAHIAGKVQKNPKDATRLEIVFTPGVVQGEIVPKKKLLVDGVARRMADFVGNLPAVLFWPQDIDLVVGSPSRRRNYLDMVLSQIDREYRRNMIAYEHGLRQRNRLLKLIREGEAGRNQLPYWDELLITHGQSLTQKREAFITYINGLQREIDEHVLVVGYDQSVISSERLSKYKDEEVAAAVTLVGPHRDDFIVKLKAKSAKRKERNLHAFGSRGEQRLAVLWLKLSEVDYIEYVTGERPILLLDDIFSELDEGHRELVMGIVGKQQTIITTTDDHFIGKTNVAYERVTLSK